MMAHYGNSVTKIEGHWVAGIDLETNIQQFNTYTGPGHNLSDNDAAKETWTGKRAKDHGFTNARVIFKDPPNAPGNYIEVYAEFTRP